MPISSRERVLAALAHQPTDRAPANYSAHQEVTDRLMGRLGVRDDEELLQALQVDLRRVRFSYHQPDTGPDEEGYLRNMWGLRHHPGKDAADPAKLVPPFDEDTTVDEVHAHAWPSPDAVDYSAIGPRSAPRHDRYVTFGSPWCPFFHEVGWLIGQETYFVWMHTRPEVVAAITQCIVDYEVEVTRRYLAACAGKLDIAYFGNDFGTQRGLFISPALWQRFLRRPLKRFFDVAHDYGCRVMQHSCGSVRAILPDYLEDGVDILDPVQIRAAGMGLDGLVRDFGSRLCFHGGVDTQQTLPFGTPAQVRAMVRAHRALTRARGGYIMTGSQDLITDIPDDNILAMYEENAAG
ncbi:MAG: uroporphyrinogen decarboxylase family protein [Candidatus Latescibacterota bacterium]